MTYLLPTPLDDAYYCGCCHSRLRRWGDWLCPKCREEINILHCEAYRSYRFRRALALAKGEEQR